MFVPISLNNVLFFVVVFFYVTYNILVTSKNLVNCIFSHVFKYSLKVSYKDFCSNPQFGSFFNIPVKFLS